MLGGQLKADLMAFRVPPPNMYQDQQATRTAARRDYVDRYANGSAALRGLALAAGAVTWPLRIAWRLVRPIG
jgi:hypothetical protein